MTNYTTISSDEYSLLVLRTRLEPRAVELGRLVFVDGIPPSDAARQVGVSRQRANGILNRLKGARYDGLPNNWQTVTVHVRPETADLILKLEAQDRRLLMTNNP